MAVSVQVPQAAKAAGQKARQCQCVNDADTVCDCARQGPLLPRCKACNRATAALVRLNTCASCVLSCDALCCASVGGCMRLSLCTAVQTAIALPSCTYAQRIDCLNAGTAEHCSGHLSKVCHERHAARVGQQRHASQYGPSLGPDTCLLLWPPAAELLGWSVHTTPTSRVPELLLLPGRHGLQHRCPQATRPGPVPPMLPRLARPPLEASSFVALPS